MFIRFDMIHERDKQTDGQTNKRTDTACRHIPHLCIASRGKNRPGPARLGHLIIALDITAVDDQFLPRDAMHKRGLCRHAVSVCLSVRHVRELRQNE